MNTDASLVTKKLIKTVARQVLIDGSEGGPNAIHDHLARFEPDLAAYLRKESKKVAAQIAEAQGVAHAAEVGVQECMRIAAVAFLSLWHAQADYWAQENDPHGLELVLLDAGSDSTSMVQIAGILNTVLDLSLNESIRLVKSVPTSLGENLPWSSAVAAKAAIEDVGGACELK